MPFKYTLNFHVNKEPFVVLFGLSFKRCLWCFSIRRLYSLFFIGWTTLRQDTAAVIFKHLSVAKIQGGIDLLKPTLDMAWIGMGD